jgi:predicted secreted protein
MKSQFRLERAVLVLSASSLFVVACFGQATQINPETVVAIVDGQKIEEYSRIRIGDNALKALFHRRYGRYPKGAADEAMIAEQRSQLEQKTLAGAIKSKVRLEVMKEHGITVTDSEVLAGQKELFENATSKSLAEQRDRLEPLIQALKAVQKKAMTGDEAYRRFLAKSMSYDDWLVQEDTYSNPGLMKTLELLASQTVESVRTKPDDSVRIMLISEKVGDGNRLRGCGNKS